jgi:hypothetical protein
MYRTHWSHLGDLSHTAMRNFPGGVPFLGPNSIYPDHILIIGLQSLFGPVMGYNLGIWILLSLLGLGVFWVTRKFTGGSWVGFAAAALFLTGRSCRLMIAQGLNYQIPSLLFTALLLAELPALFNGNVNAGRRAGLWLALAGISYWFFGYLLVLILAPAIGCYWCIEKRGMMKAIKPAVWAVLVAVPVTLVPFVWVLSNISTISGLQGGLEQSLFPPDDYMQEELMRTFHMAITWDKFFWEGWLRPTVTAFAIIGFFLLDSKWKVFWAAFVAMAVIISLGPVALDGRPEDMSVIKLPYWYLYHYFPLLWRFRYLNRVSMFLDLALVVAAAQGLMFVAKQRFRWRMAVPVCVIVVLGFFETNLLFEEGGGLSDCMFYSRSRVHASAGPEGKAMDEGLRSLRSNGGNAVIVFPTDGFLLQTMHGLPMVNHEFGLMEQFRKQIPEIHNNHLFMAVAERFINTTRTFVREDATQLFNLGVTHLLVDLSRYQFPFLREAPVRKCTRARIRGQEEPNPNMDGLAETFRSSPLGKNLDQELGAPEEHGWILIYKFGSTEE